MPLPSRQTLYRVNCRLFRVGYVRQRSGVIGPRTSLPDSAPLTPSPPRPPPPLPGLSTYAHRWYLTMCAHRCTVASCVCVCVHRSRSNRTRSCSQCRIASGRESASFALFSPPTPPFAASPFWDSFVLYSTMCRRRVVARDRISRLFYACAFIANSKYRPIPISPQRVFNNNDIPVRQAAASICRSWRFVDSDTTMIREDSFAKSIPAYGKRALRRSARRLLSTR